VVWRSCVVGANTVVTSDDVLKATIATLQAAGLDVTLTTEGGVVEVVITRREDGQRYVVRDRDPWVAPCQAAEHSGFEFGD